MERLVLIAIGGAIALIGLKVYVYWEERRERKKR